MKNSEMSAAEVDRERSRSSSLETGEDEDGLLALVERLRRPIHKADLRFVTKVVNPQGVDPDLTPHNFLDRVELFNALFTETAYELIGFSRDPQERFVVILRQPFIEGS